MQAIDLANTPIFNGGTKAVYERVEQGEEGLRRLRRRGANTSSAAVKSARKTKRRVRRSPGGSFLVSRGPDCMLLPGRRVLGRSADFLPVASAASGRFGTCAFFQESRTSTMDPTRSDGGFGRVLRCRPRRSLPLSCRESPRHPPIRADAGSLRRSLRRILEMAQFAPSVGFMQPWNFILSRRSRSGKSQAAIRGSRSA